MRATTEPKNRVGARVVVERADLQSLLDALSREGYRTLGPTLRDGVIAYDEIASVADLPEGWSDEQEGGTYRLVRRADGALFGYTLGPQSWKRFLHPPVQRLSRVLREGTGFRTVPEPAGASKLAFVGARACEIQAIAIQDRVLRDGPFPDAAYAARRAGIFVVAVHCGRAAATCFCASMGTGPKAGSGFDLALTEMIADGRHWFDVEVGTEAGARMLEEVPHRDSGDGERRAADALPERAAAGMGRTLDTKGIRDLLVRASEHPRWDDAASRCLACGNCTAVCPTCFCTTVEDSTDLAGAEAERRRRWDSCFGLDFSYIHGGSVRASARSRYRQWLTHKLGTWIDQFGVSGCVGCGRCITWCPVGIDLTAEIAALRRTGGARKGDFDENA